MEESYHDYIFESKHKKQKKIFFYLYVIMITFRTLEELVKEKLPAFGDEKRDYILSVKLSRLQNHKEGICMKLELGKIEIKDIQFADK